MSRLAYAIAALTVVAVCIGTIWWVHDTRRSPASRTLEEMQSLPYLTWVPTAAGASGEQKSPRRGVTLHDTARAVQGLNLYCSRNESRARLLDMDGELVHKWSRRGTSWQHVELDGDGNLFVIIKDKALLKLDWQSRLVWQVRGHYHHDIALGPDGRVYALARRIGSIERGGTSYPIVDDMVVQHAPDGTIEARYPMADRFGDYVSNRALLAIADHEASGDLRRVVDGISSPYDVFHTNTIEFLDGPVGGVGEAGHFLVSALALSRIGIFDPAGGAPSWVSRGGKLVRQHMPTIIDDDTILVFDNRGGEGGFSRLVEIAVPGGDTEWTWDGDPPQSFESRTRGGNERLPGGNTLVTESDRGRVFEITRDGEMVWEFFNPSVQRKRRLRAAIYRMSRILPARAALLPFEPEIRADLARRGYLAD